MLKKTNISFYILLFITFTSIFALSLQAKAASVNSEWAFYVYINADNNLDEAGVKDIKEMTKGLKDNENIKVAVQIDRLGQGAARYEIKPNKAVQLQDMGEINMGSYHTLVEFFEWAHSKFPAKKTALVIWNHGSGWVKKEKNNNSAIDISRGISYDDQSGEHITTPQLRTALRKISSINNGPVDIIGFDACLMNMFEVAWELRDYALYCVGSEETEPGDGWPYKTILSALSKLPAMPADQLSKTIVDKYIFSYWLPLYSVTQSAIDLKALKAFKDDFNMWTDVLIKNIPDEKRLISDAWHETVRFYYEPYGDLFRFAKNIKSKIPLVFGNKELKTATAKLLTWEKRVVIASRAKGSVSKAKGLAITMLAPLPHSLPFPYRQLDFSIQTKWDEFLDIFRPLPPVTDENNQDDYYAQYQKSYHKANLDACVRLVKKLSTQKQGKLLKSFSMKIDQLAPDQKKEFSSISKLIDVAVKNLELNSVK